MDMSRWTTAWAALCAVLACAAPPPTTAPAPDDPPATPGASETETPARSGLVLELRGAPAEVTVEVFASDDRPPLAVRSPWVEPEGLEVPAGFVTLVMTAAGERRQLEAYLHAGARIHVDWDDPDAITIEGGERLDRTEAERQWTADLEALMTAVSQGDGQGPLPQGVQQLLDAQRSAIEDLGDTPRAHLLRLRHASFVAQLAGARAAWAIVDPVPADSIAWAAYSPWLVELGWFLREIPEAHARLSEVRGAVADVGLQSAFTALDLLSAERSDQPDALAHAYRDATRADGPVVVGQPMPAFELRSVDDRSAIRSDALEGTPYLLEVWSTWCEPCIAQMKDLHALHEAMGAGERPALRVISVAVDDTRAPIVAFRRDRWPMPWANAWVPDGDPLFGAWAITGVPYAVLVDQHGIVRAADRHVEPDLVQQVAAPPKSPIKP